MAPLMCVPLSPMSFSIPSGATRLKLLSPQRVGEDAVVTLAPNGGRGVGAATGPSLKRRLGPQSSPLRSHETHFCLTDQSRSEGRHYWTRRFRLGSIERTTRLNDCRSLTLIFLRRQSSHFLCAFSPCLFARVISPLGEESIFTCLTLSAWTAKHFVSAQ